MDGAADLRRGVQVARSRRCLVDGLQVELADFRIPSLFSRILSENVCEGKMPSARPDSIVRAWHARRSDAPRMRGASRSDIHQARSDIWAGFRPGDGKSPRDGSVVADRPRPSRPDEGALSVEGIGRLPPPVLSMGRVTATQC